MQNVEPEPPKELERMQRDYEMMKKAYERGFPNEKRLKSYPAVKLCRLGVDDYVKKQRIRAAC